MSWLGAGCSLGDDMRPEDVIVQAEAQRFCGREEIELDEVRHVRATCPPIWTGEGPDKGFIVILGPARADGRRLRLVCHGWEFQFVAHVRLI